MHTVVFKFVWNGMNNKINFFSKILSSYTKNKSEINSLVSFSAPQYIYGRKNFSDIPVFCSHSVEPELFEKQLKFLNENSFSTLSGDEYLERITDKKYKNNGKDILLTFDDGMSSVWTTGLPLLEKYNKKITAFVLPGLTSESNKVGSTINDELAADEYAAVLKRDFSDEPLCNWAEIEALHNSGYVDIESHGMFHMLVSTSPKIIDFVNPDFDPYHYGNIHIPGFVKEKSGTVMYRDFVLGHPVYKHFPRLGGQLKYLDSDIVRNACESYVKDNGDASFFKRNNWRQELMNVVDELKPANLNYETDDEMMNAMRDELVLSKSIIESRLSNKTVRQFCFPWFAACEKSAKLAHEAGYEAIHLGAGPGFKPLRGVKYPEFVTRLQEEYLMNLPGKGKISLLEVLKSKLNSRKGTL